MHPRAVTGNRADTHKSRHGHHTDRHGCTRFRHNVDLCGRRQVPLEGTAGGKPAPVEEVKRLQLQTSQAVCRFLERLASLLLVRLLDT